MKGAKLLTGTLYFLVVLYSGCTFDSSTGGGGSDAGNGIIVGYVKNSEGSYAANVKVSIASSDYDPVKRTGLYSKVTAYTNEQGKYAFRVQVPTTYTIEAILEKDKTRFLLSGIKFEKDSTIIAPNGLLSKTGSIKVSLPDSFDYTNGYVYLPGTNLFVIPKTLVNYVVLDSVPAGIIPYIKSNSKKNNIEQIIRYQVSVSPEDTTEVVMPLWRYSKTIALNTTSTGANVAANVYNFPLLVRLTDSNFDFTKTQAGGNDLRFTKSDGALLPYEIEAWDSLNQRAEVWVKIDTVFGNESSQSISMLYGNSNAVALSNSELVFDTALGFTAVWHLAGLPSDTAFDASGNRFNGVPSGMNRPSAVLGNIGPCRAFDGITNAIEIPGTASGKLNFPEKGTYTLSAWVYIDTLVDSVTQMIVGKGAQQYFLKNYLSHKWQFTEFHSANGWNMTSDSSVMAKKWVHLTGVRDGSIQELYVNGMRASSDIVVGNLIFPLRDTTENVSIGRYIKYHDYYKQGFAFFGGKIDEVRIGNKKLGADWIKLSYMNQKEIDMLLKFQSK